MTADCQPASGEGAAAPAPLTAGAFETVAIDAGATAIPAPKPVPAVSLRTTALKAKGRRVKVALSCTAADCKGALTLKAGTKSVAAKKSYSLKSGARQTVTLTLTKSAQKALKQQEVAEGHSAHHRHRRQDHHEDVHAAMKTLLIALCAAMLAVPATASAAPKRVVAIEWDTVENLHMLGMGRSARPT